VPSLERIVLLGCELIHAILWPVQGLQKLKRVTD
jgi:hypothetical protein